MAIYYSAAEGTKGFYDSEIHKIIPSDAVQISVTEHQALLQATSGQNKIIVPDENGLPILVDRPEMSTADLISMQNNNIIKQIIVIETERQPRALREATLTGNLTRLTEIENEIIALRAQLQ